MVEVAVVMAAGMAVLAVLARVERAANGGA
jgi:hypothetical protein